MRVHHINCGTMCPMGGRLLDGKTAGLGPAHLVCHCLLIETDAGLVLVDTGFGMQDVQNPRARLPRFFTNLNNIRFDPQDTALARVKALGFRPLDVRHVVLTHLDFDHAGGISDFPLATVHVFATEARIARERKGALRRLTSGLHRRELGVRLRLDLLQLDGVVRTDQRHVGAVLGHERAQPLLVRRPQPPAHLHHPLVEAGAGRSVRMLRIHLAAEEIGVAGVQQPAVRRLHRH
ncbi:MAG: MBL fold metallo-hydrolase, partial [Alphaproteobacteria bacterium]|nr:MBL fold metallo-hydrolase [Alphaproteobacteria bacterium]